MAGKLLISTAMHGGQFPWKARVYLALGALLGVGATLGYQRIGTPARPVASAEIRSSRAVPATSGPVLLASASTAPSANASPKGGRPGPGAAADWERAAARFAAPSSDRSVARSLLLRLDEKALRKLAADVATWPRSRRNGRILGEIFHRWGELAPQTAIAQAQALPPDLAYAAVRDTVDGFAESDPAGASAYLAAPPAGAASAFLRSDWSRSIRLGQALENWAEQDAAAAVGFANGLPPGAYRAYILDSIAQDWMRQDPAAALGWAQGLGAPNQRASALDGIVTTWAQTDPAAAGNYVLGLADGPDRNDLVRTLADHWASQDPPTAARWAAQQSGVVQAQAAAAVAETWAEVDPQAVLAWSNQFPDGDTRNAAWAALAKEWYVNDPPAAQAWLNGLPRGDGRDAAIVGATEYWNLRNQPAEILGLVQGISDPQVRANTLTGVLNTWLGNDATAAWRWISQTDLPATVTGKLKGG